MMERECKQAGYGGSYSYEFDGWEWSQMARSNAKLDVTDGNWEGNAVRYSLRVSSQRSSVGALKRHGNNTCILKMLKSQSIPLRTWLHLYTPVQYSTV